MNNAIRMVALKQMQAFAGSHLGERPPGSNLGAFVAKVLKPAGLTPPQPYCAATVSYAYSLAATLLGVGLPFEYTAGALNLFRECEAKGWALKSAGDIQPGDIIVWDRGPVNSGHGHAGIVSAGANEGRILTIEANHSSTVDYFHYIAGNWERNLAGVIRIPAG